MRDQPIEAVCATTWREFALRCGCSEKAKEIREKIVRDSERHQDTIRIEVVIVAGVLIRGVAGYSGAKADRTFKRCYNALVSHYGIDANLWPEPSVSARELFRLPDPVREDLAA